MFLKVVLVSCYQIVWMEKMCLCSHMFFESSVGFVLSNCLNAKKKKNTFGMRNTQYSIDLSVHKHPRVYNTTYKIQSRVNCPSISRKIKNQKVTLRQVMDKIFTTNS